MAAAAGNTGGCGGPRQAPAEVVLTDGEAPAIQACAANAVGNAGKTIQRQSWIGA